MNKTTKLLAAVVTAACSMPAIADDHDDYMISMTEIGVTMGHGMEFRNGMKAYIECYEEEGGENAWSVWWPVGGKLNTMLMVSRMDMWAEMDEEDPASEACWSVVREQIWPHMDTVERSFAKRMPDWSGDADDYSVVTLHNFRVEDGEAFREVVGEITGYMKEAEYEHMGTWYDVQGSTRWAADYFVVDHYGNFSAMDEDRDGANGVMVAAIGEEAAAETWDRFGDSLAEMEPYWTRTLRRDDEVSYSPGDD
ncbi:hypothetical protein HFP89_12800 [Wenzhouxiangella sp. XN79A]|uniref:hypothetical protein n=1 Tax=Wenzhouxiangella sp. XN79A TaxID=2724193 RepID=UPI00144AD5FE|nr:hypothetical protein [Wenzhouxiangella sp. XN79A]NKI36042.1 hypothetical protein [Wenzhouxiangella sp. XN79A]